MATAELTQFDIDLRRFCNLKDEIAKTEAALKMLKGETAKIEAVLVEEYALKGIQSINAHGQCIYLTHETSITVKADCKRAAVEVARSLGLDDLIVLQPWNFKSYCKEMLADETAGNAIPVEFTELVNVYEATRVRARKA